MVSQTPSLVNCGFSKLVLLGAFLSGIGLKSWGCPTVGFKPFVPQGYTLGLGLPPTVGCMVRLCPSVSYLL